MRSTFKITGIILCCLVGLSLLSLRQPEDNIGQTIAKRLTLQADSLLDALRVLRATPANASFTAMWQRRFRTARLAYKRLEWAAEYFDPLTTRKFNGPPVPETELDGQVFPPDGLQVIEQDIFPRFDPTKKAALKILLNNLATNAEEFSAYFRHADLQNWQILDAAKLEVFRVEVLGLNDFDDPLSKNCFRESAAALQSVQEVTRRYTKAIDFNPAIHYLLKPVAFSRFDRAAFITAYANPLTRELAALPPGLKTGELHYNRLLNQDAPTLFDTGAFNRNAYTAAPGDSATLLKIALGKKLFFDPILSGNGLRSCSSCHQPEKAFTDGMVKNLDITGKKFIARNTPTLINAALQPAQFYDLRAPSLEDQVNDVVQNRDEMHGDMQVSTGKLWRDTVYRHLFATAFPQQHRLAIDTFEVMNALASYVRSLTALNSRFDRYMQGNKAALSQSEVDGFNIFMGKARCSTCHYLPLFSGALPPRYMQMEAEVIGVPGRKGGKRIDPDPGLFDVRPQEFNRHAFKTTTVRNAALTAPYMHNGVFKTLEEVIDFYNKGGGVGSGIKIPNQTLSADNLKLTIKEKSDLIAFIKSLNSNL
jgi:cytochrome c peroxidase